ncbi:hypothetical protein GW17_00009621 [Ensete ventricosum]|nr:hypothetical protein GW17_00009621 [Ensete ventricosum]
MKVLMGPTMSWWEITTHGDAASGRSKDNAVGNSLGVHRELTKGIRSLPGWRKGVRRKIVGGSQNACWELGSCRPDMEPGLPEEDLETHHKECRRLLDCGSDVIKLDGYVWL